MKCPVCNVTLLISDKQGVEIDYCPQCRGIWLDRGELEKIVERSNPQNVRADNIRFHDYDDDDDNRHHYPKDHQDGHYHKKKKGFWNDILDF